MASKKDRTSSSAGATTSTAPPAGSPAGDPGAAENGTGGEAKPETSEEFSIVAARQAIPVLDRALRAWDRALGAQHTPAGFAVEFVAHIEPSRLERIQCASPEELSRLAEDLALAYPLVPATDWLSALSAKRGKPRSSAGRSAGKTPRKARTGTQPGASGESAHRSDGATGAATSASPDPTAARVELTLELRAQHRIPGWADGSDIRPGEDLAAYARRKRVTGAPPDRSKFIGE